MYSNPKNKTAYVLNVDNGPDVDPVSKFEVYVHGGPDVHIRKYFIEPDQYIGSPYLLKDNLELFYKVNKNIAADAYHACNWVFDVNFEMIEGWNTQDWEDDILLETEKDEYRVWLENFVLNLAN